MSLSLTQNFTAIVPRMKASFLGIGGTAPYVYSVVPGGAGGTIDPDSGVYVAPSTQGATPQTLYDTIQVTDDDATVASSQILVASPLFLVCEIIEKEMNLSPGRVYLWDQKIFQPSDQDIYVPISVVSCKPFANNRRSALGDGSKSIQSVNMSALLDINIISKGPGARDRKEEILLALNSAYSQQQQESNSFFIGALPTNSRFMNLSLIDGSAIPYRFTISVTIQYAITKSQSIPYFDTFQEEVVTNP